MRVIKTRESNMDVQKARYLRRNSTDAERLLWNRLRARQICDCKFRRQQPIGPYIVDFVCLERRLVIEVDGGQHQRYAEYDERRTRWLEGRGYRVLRFWNHEVLNNIDAVLQSVRLILDPGVDSPDE